MGSGIRTLEGDDPLVVWRMKVHSYADARTTSALKDLLSGRTVIATDGILEVSAQPIATPDAFRVSVRRPEAPFVAEFVMSAWDSRAAPDPSSPLPTPDQWLTVLGDDRTQWELFNCTIHRLGSRENT